MSKTSYTTFGQFFTTFHLFQYARRLCLNIYQDESLPPNAQSNIATNERLFSAKIIKIRQ